MKPTRRQVNGRHGRRIALGADAIAISNSALAGDLSLNAYAAAKAGLNALTIAFAHAFGPKVRVNCIQAGPFATDISKAWTPAMFQHVERTFPLRRVGQPEEIVGAALYFASDASSYTTGAILRVDGGNP